MSSGPAIPPSYGAREAQPLEDMIEQTAGYGWADFLPPDPKDKRGSWEERLADYSNEAARVAAVVMSTPEGRVLLEYLADVSVRRPMFFVGMPDAATYAALREGQNGLFFTLLKLIAVGRQEQPTVREGT